MSDVPNKGGRPVGSLQKRTQADVDKARSTGKLPHEILLDIARGDPTRFVDIDPRTNLHTVRWEGSADIDVRLDAAYKAAPYYAPKLATVEVLQGVSDDDLDSLIASLLHQAGLGALVGGEGEADGEDEEAPSRPRRRLRTE